MDPYLYEKAGDLFFCQNVSCLNSEDLILFVTNRIYENDSDMWNIQYLFLHHSPSVQTEKQDGPDPSRTLSLNTCTYIRQT